MPRHDEEGHAKFLSQYLKAHSDLLTTKLDTNGQLQLVGDYPMQAHATFSNLDVAPTIAKLLGVSLPTAKGKALQLQ